MENYAQMVPQSNLCPICATGSELIAYAVIAPFIAELSDLPQPTLVGLRRCQACDLDFFDGRFSDDQLSAIYGGYRTDRYFEVRKRWEPWYSRSVNDALVVDQDAIDDRLRFMNALTEEFVAKRPPKLVVDFGGDEGQFIPEWPGARRVVCDPSDKPLPAGIERIERLSDLGGDQPDFVIIAHVLEHLVDPLSVLTEVNATLSESGFLYVEVPLDRPRVRSWHASSEYARMLERAGKRRSSFVPMDFATGVSRQFRRRVPRCGAVKESEHINYFSEKSLRKLLTAAGFDSVSCASDPQASVGGLKLGRLGVVATKSPNSE